MYSRAVNGVARPIFYRGEQVGEYRHYDERLGMFLLRFRRPHRYGMLPRFVPAVPPGSENEEPDPDEAIETLDFHRADLEDMADEPAADHGSSDGVKLVKFQLEQPSGSAASVEEPATAGRPAPQATGPTAPIHSAPAPRGG